MLMVKVTVGCLISLICLYRPHPSRRWIEIRTKESHKFYFLSFFLAKAGPPIRHGTPSSIPHCFVWKINLQPHLSPWEGNKYCVPPWNSTPPYSFHMKKVSTLYIWGGLLCPLISEGHFTFYEGCRLWIYGATHSFQMRGLNPSATFPYGPLKGEPGWSKEFKCLF